MHPPTTLRIACAICLLALVASLAGAEVLFDQTADGFRCTVEGPPLASLKPCDPLTVKLRVMPDGFEKRDVGAVTVAGSPSPEFTLIVPEGAVNVTAVPVIGAYYAERGGIFPQPAEQWRPLKIRSQAAIRAHQIVGFGAEQLIGLVPILNKAHSLGKLAGKLGDILKGDPQDWMVMARFENEFHAYRYVVPAWDGDISALEVQWSLALKPTPPEEITLTLEAQFATDSGLSRKPRNCIAAVTIRPAIPLPVAPTPPPPTPAPPTAPAG